MCGRYTLFTPAQEAEIRAIVKEAERRASEAAHANITVATGEIFPTNLVPVLLPETDRFASFAMRWGFPGFKGGNVIINARAETAGIKPMFRHSLENRRCIIPSTGFYEWKTQEDKQKTKYLFNLPGTSLLYMAGIYNKFRMEDGSEENRFTILTTEANPSMADVHNRMPVILRPGEYDQWIDGDYLALLHRELVTLDKKIA